MKALRLLSLFLLPCMMAAAEIAPEIAPFAERFKTDSEAVAASQTASLIRLAHDYQAALDAAEKTATTTGDVKVLAAITAERDALKAGSLKTTASADLPKTLLNPRKTYFAGVAKVDADILPRKQRVVADYLRALTSLQSKSAGNAALLTAIGAEKDRLIRSAPVNLSDLTKRLGGTKWRNSGGSNLSLNEDGTAQTKQGKNGTWKATATDRLEVLWEKNASEEYAIDAELKSLTRTKDTNVYMRQR
jgi:hypothetical protein